LGAFFSLDKESAIVQKTESKKERVRRAKKPESRKGCDMSMEDEDNILFGLGSGCMIHGEEFIRECRVCGTEYCAQCYPGQSVCSNCVGHEEEADSLDDEYADELDEDSEVEEILNEADEIPMEDLEDEEMEEEEADRE
jgi:hypothetical protein